MTTTTNGAQVRFVVDTVAVPVTDIEEMVAKLRQIYDIVACSDDRDHIAAQGDRIWMLADRLERLTGAQIP